MKNYSIKIFSLFIVLFSMQSCEDYLREEPLTDYYADQVFSTEAGVESAVNGMYIEYSSFDYHGSGFQNLLMPSSGKFFSPQFANLDATSLNCTPNNPNLNDLWSGAYQTINSANNIIKNLTDSDIQLSNKNSALGQAHLLRAMTYFDIVRIWSKAPLKTEPATTETLFTPLSPKDVLYDFIISELELAKTLLPNVGEGRIDRPSNLVANAILGKVYIQLAGEDNGDPNLWQNAYDELMPIYGQYSLVSNFEAVFDINNENNSESMFEIQYTTEGGTRSSDLVRLYAPNGFYANVNTFGRIRPNKEVFEQHVDQYPGDPRIDAGFFYSSYTIANGSNQNIYPTTSNGNNGFPLLKKYLDPTYNGITTNRNFYKLRYADVLLMLAEVTNELNGPTTEAYGYVNEVLARARTRPDGTQAAEPADWSALSQGQFRSQIMRERQYELLGEGHIWFDTRRRGYAYFIQEVIENHNNFPGLNVGNKDFIYPITVRNMLLPIPSSEIDTNQAISEGDQNPGY